MQQYQKDFISFVLANKALRFGKFILKSGRVSPYFFNVSHLFNSGKNLSKLGGFYAASIKANTIDFDTLFGPAYKGIPLAAATAMALNDTFAINKMYSFNRKELKDHGEGGIIVGNTLMGNVLVIDDVITKGTAIFEVVNIINASKAKLSAVIVAIDRQERGESDISAIKEIEKKFAIKVFSIVNLANIISYLKQNNDTKYIAKIEAYINKYREKC